MLKKSRPESRSLIGSLFPWYLGNYRLLTYSGKLLGSHVAHGSVMMFWSGSMVMFEISHMVYSKPYFEQGFINIPHISSLGICLGPSSDLIDSYPLLVIGAGHLISASFLSLGGIYHSLFGPDSLEESSIGLLFGFSWQDRSRITSVLSAHLWVLSFASILVFVKSLYCGGLYDCWCSGGGDVRIVRAANVSFSPFSLFRYLFRSPFGLDGWIVSVNNLEDFVGGHYWLGVYLSVGAIFHSYTKPLAFISRGFIWSSEAYLSYSLAAISSCGFVASTFSWYNNTFYPSEFYGPTGPEASQAQGFTFLIRDQQLGIKVETTQGPSSLGKYLMRSPSGELILGGETMRFWSVQSDWCESLRSSTGLDLYKIQTDVQPWQERKSSEYMTHAPLGSINSVGGVATEINSINYVSPRSWLTSSHWIMGYFILVGHWWHAGRSRLSSQSGERGLSRNYESLLYHSSLF